MLRIFYRIFMSIDRQKNLNDWSNDSQPGNTRALTLFFATLLSSCTLPQAKNTQWNWVPPRYGYGSIWTNSPATAPGCMQDAVYPALSTPGCMQDKFRIYTFRMPQWGTLLGAARHYGVSLEDILRVNPEIRNPDYVQEGAPVRVPVCF